MVPGSVAPPGGRPELEPCREEVRQEAPGQRVAVVEEEVVRRVEGDQRPLLADAPYRLARVRELLAARAGAYAGAAHTVDTTGLGVVEVVERVQSLVAGR